MKNSLWLHFPTRCLRISGFCACFFFSTGSSMTFSFPCAQDLITLSTVNIAFLRAQALFHMLLASRLGFLEEVPGMCDANLVEIKQDAWKHDFCLNQSFWPSSSSCPVVQPLTALALPGDLPQIIPRKGLIRRRKVNLDFR